MKQHFDPTTWIDRQRAAGMNASNVFEDILAAAKSIRLGQTKKADYRVERRVAEVHEMRRAAASFDREVVGANGMTVHTLCGEKVQSVGEMIQRWKGLR